MCQYAKVIFIDKPKRKATVITGACFNITANHSHFRVFNSEYLPQEPSK